MDNLTFKGLTNIAHNRWKSIFEALNIDVGNGEHMPCPICGGKDRFRFDDKYGNGEYYCNQCLSGNGFNLVAGAKSVSLKESLHIVNGVIGNATLLVNNTNKSVYQKEKANNLFSYIWSQSKAAITHEYLTIKGINANGAKVSDQGDLVLSIRDADNNLKGLQFIKPDGAKKICPRSILKGNFGSIISADNNKLFICEGFSTACSIFEATKQTVIYSFSANNLLNVAKNIRHKSTKTLVICGDNDKAGIDAANSCTQTITDCVSVFPFQYNDFNDEYLFLGKQSLINTLGDI